jgi:protease YdgD
MAGLGRRAAAAALLLAAMAAAPGALRAQQPPQPGPEMRSPPAAMLRPGVGAVDPRRQVDHTAEPWRGLGRVQTELGGRCTGALVAPDMVLTAAHCLVAPRSDRLVRPGTVHFLLGYHLGDYAAHARVASFTVGPGFRAAPLGPAGADWALLRLERPVGTPADVLPLLPEPPRAGGAVMLGGYQRDRPEAILADSTCRVLGPARGAGGDGLLLHDCAGTRGASGAPVLARGADGRWGIAGVAVGIASGTALGAAVPAATVARALR